MSNPSIHPDLDRLLAKLMDEGLQPAEQEQLGRILRDDAASRHFYRKYLIVDALLRWENAPPIAARHDATEEEQTQTVPRGLGTSVPSGAAISFPISDPQSPIPDLSVQPSFFILPHPLPSPLSPLPSFFGSMLFSYVAAAVILGVALMVASVWKMSAPAQIARESSTPAARQRESGLSREFIGRITGMVDCHWTDPQTEAFNGANVLLGRKYALASGLLEITYNSGAKVILQGPVTYEVESPSSGFLSVGKLTARVEKKAESGKRKADSPLSTLHSPLFAVRTPTAVVTDLGTEFGVEVSESGNTSAHVFRGLVEVQPLEHNSQAVRLTENQSVQIEKAANGEKLQVQRGIADPTTFVRAEQLPKLAEEQRLKPFRRWQASSEELRKDPSLLAYYDFQQTPGSPDVLRNAAANGDKSLNGTVENAIWTAGRMAGKHALRFIVRDAYVRTNLPQDIEDLTLTAWINVHSLDKPYSALLMSDNWRQSGEVHWQLRDDGRMILAISGHTDDFHPYQSRPVFDRTLLDRWLHVAAAYDHATASVRFYLNGQSVGETTVPGHVPIRIGSARIGCWPGMDEDRNFRGRIDEMAIFSRSLRSGDIQRMFEAGKPADATDTRSESTASHRTSGNQAKARKP